MLPYVIPLVFAGLLAIRYDFNNHRDIGKKIGYLGLYIYLTLLIGLRFEVGGDTLAYMGDYNWRVPLEKWELNFLDPYQPAYTLLCSLGKTLSPEFYVFQLIHSSIFNALLLIFIKKNTGYIFSALIGVFLSCYLYFATEILRECLAVMIFVLNYPNLKNKKWLRYYVGVFLSIMFHASALFLIFIPIFRKLQFNSTYLKISIILLILLFFSRPILVSLSSWPIFMGKISAGYIASTTSGIQSDLLRLSRYLILPLVFVLLSKVWAKKQIQFENMVAILSLIGMASYFNFIIFGRLINYFILFFIVSIVDFCISALKSNNRILKQYGVALTISYFLLFGSEQIMYRKYTRWVPYYSIFNPVSVNRDNYSDR